MCDEPEHAGEAEAAVPRAADGLAVDPIALPEVDEITITTLADNVFDALLASTPGVTRVQMDTGAVPAVQFTHGTTSAGLRAEHGFSALVSVRGGNSDSTLLFDTGVSPDGMAVNAQRLGIGFGEVQGVVLSHGHFDHAGGFDGLARARGRSGLPLTVHPAIWTRRRVALPGRAPFEMPTLSKGALEREGFQVIERREPSLLAGGSVLITGEVDRTTDFERGMPPAHQAWDGHGWGHDAKIIDDQALIVNVRGRGLQHRQARDAAHRRDQGARGPRRVSPERPGVRAGHRADGSRAYRARAGAGRPGALHWLAGPARARAGTTRRLGAEQRGHQLPDSRCLRQEGRPRAIRVAIACGR